MSALNDVNSLDEASAYLRIEAPALRRLVNQRRIGYLRSGRTLTFTREAVEAYIDANTVQATPPPPFGLTDASARRIRGRAA